MKAKIRGIYATALTKFLIDNGFKIAQPSKVIQARLNLQENCEPPDIIIKDRYDLQGIIALGTAEAINNFQAIIHENLEDAITRKWKPSVDGIYKGKIISEGDSIFHVKISEDIVGILPKEEVDNKKSEWLLVQVDRRRIGRKNPLLSTRLRIVGKYAILVKGSRGGVSLCIHDLNKRSELCNLGSQLAPEGWGIIWREPAAQASKKILEEEATKLAEKAKTLEKLSASKDAPSLLLEASYFMDIEFPSASKKKLDELRGYVTATIEGHHFYKSCGGRVSATLEMAERLLEKGECASEVKEMFRRQVEPEFPEEGSIVDVKHVKLSGSVFNLGKATIESLDADRLTYSRTIKCDGIYDGLNVPKEAGDKAVSETILGEDYIITKYLSKDGVLKGAYVNLNTPVEIYPNAIRYVDLEVDVCLLPDGSKKILEVNKLEGALNRGLISKQLFEKTLKKAKRILEDIEIIS